MHAAAKQKSLVVVLGMHRSGTSAITRGLMTMGVDLGDRLMPPEPEINEKGFFEDIDVNGINVELLKIFQSEWHDLKLLPESLFGGDRLHALKKQAIELLRSRLHGCEVFGIKDPRLCRLLPFWQEVFRQVPARVFYLIAERNPLSVARSLEKAYRLPPEKSHYLWLEHLVPAVLQTQNAPRMVVGYDLFLDHPEEQLVRIAQFLCLKNNLDQAKVAEFGTEFLEERLRHTRFHPGDVIADALVPNPVKTAAILMSDLAADREELNSEPTNAKFADLAIQLDGMAQALSYLSRLDGLITELQQGLQLKVREIGKLEQNSSENADRVESLNQQNTKLERQAVSLADDVAERNRRIEAQNREIKAQWEQIAALQKEACVSHQEIETLAKEIKAREQQAAVLQGEVADLNLRLEELSIKVADREDALVAIRKEVAVRDSRLEELSVKFADQEEALVVLHQELVEHAEQVATLTKTAAKLEGELSMFSTRAVEQDQQIEALSEEVSRRNEQLVTTTQCSDAHARTAAALTLEIAEKEQALQQLANGALQFNYRLERIKSGPEWKLHKMVRRFKRSFSPNKRRQQVGLIPVHQVEAGEIGWLAKGSDPQFLLVADRAWRGLAGWHWLELEVVSEQPLSSMIFFDVGSGFDCSRSIHFELSGQRRQRIPLYIPFNCSAIRFDPCDHPAEFDIPEAWLFKKEAAGIPDEFLAQVSQFEGWGGREGNISGLAPINQIARHDGPEYCWRSEGEDPWFLLEGFQLFLKSGWCRVELRIRANIAGGNARLYLDMGNDFNEADSVLVPFVSGETMVVFARLKQAPRQIRLDPFDCSARFSVERLDLANISEKTARTGMLERLTGWSMEFRDQSPKVIWKSLRKQAEESDKNAGQLLVDLYCATFSLRGMQDAVTYADWIERNETQAELDHERLDQARRTFSRQPVVSVIMPVYNTPEEYLRKAIASVVRQSYPEWELCIADDASSEPHVRQVLEEYANGEPRIKLVFRAENGHISAASNSALTLASGEYVALLDHDDELAGHALHYVVEAIDCNPAAKIIYSDEDKIDTAGRRSDPHFKTDWNPDLFLSQNYVSHLGVYRRELLEQIGGFRLGVEGSQDQDLLLRCMHHIEPGEIVHIPRVLYHWRILEGSTALGAVEKNYTTDAGIKVLRDYFNSKGKSDIRVENGLVPNTYRVRYPLPEPAPLVSLLIPTRDGLALLEPCIRSILERTTYPNYEILILDNESAESATHDYFVRIQAEDERVRVLEYHQPFNFSAINNYGVEHTKGDLVGLINNDIEVISSEWLNEMVSHAVRPEIGCVGAKLYYEDDTIQHAGVIIGLGGVAGHSHKNFSKQKSGYFHRLKVVQNLSAVTAACLVVRKSIYLEVGGLEEDLPVAFNDVDFCLKVRKAGYRNLWTPYAELYHYESKSRGLEDTPEKVDRFNGEINYIRNRWNKWLARDPYYSPNLTLAREDFSYR